MQSTQKTKLALLKRVASLTLGRIARSRTAKVLRSRKRANAALSFDVFNKLLTAGMWPISFLLACERAALPEFSPCIFAEKSRRNVEKSRFSKKNFWTISQWPIAYVLSWSITYFCAKFQLLTSHRLRVYKEQTDRTKKNTQVYINI